MSELTPRQMPDPDIYSTASVIVIGSDGKPLPPPPRVEYRERVVYRDKRVWWLPFLIPAAVLLFLAGLFLGAKIESDSQLPATTTTTTTAP